MAGDAPSPSPSTEPPADAGEAAAVPLALYRRYRPATFAEVKGQEHVTEPLRQALRSGRVHHAYLFSGPRGCGKTSSARILARSLNCEQGPTPDPCGVCASCVALAPAGPGSIDVIEIDAASHGGVDDARDLRERAFYAPVSGRFKIYIIDEAHMVTREGFNALLKLVEEPPPHLKFVFATTEPEKVISTIRSRTHHYPFRLVPPAVLRELLEEILGSEKISYEPAVLPVVIRAGAGSVRDSLSVLDQLIAGSDESGLRYDRAVALLGYTDDSLLDEVTSAFAAADGAAVFRAIDRVVEGGHDPRRFAADLLDRLRDLIIFAAVPDAAASGLLDAPPDRLARMSEQAAAMGQPQLVSAAETISAGLVEMRGATSPRLQLELMCAQVLLPAPGSRERDLLARLDRLERRAEAAGLAAGSEPAGAAAAGAPARPGPAGGRAEDARQAARDAAGGRQRPPAADRPPAAREPAGDSQQTACAGQQPAEEGRKAAAGPRETAGGGHEQPDRGSGPAAGAQAAAPAGPAASATAAAGRTAQDRPAADGPAPDDPGAGAPPAGARTAGARTAGEPASGGAVSAETIRDRWPDVLAAVRRQRKVAWILLGNAAVGGFAENVLTLNFGQAGQAKGFAASGYDRDLAAVLEEMFGIAPQIRAIFGAPPGQAGTAPYPDGPQDPGAAPGRPPGPAPGSPGAGPPGSRSGSSRSGPSGSRSGPSGSGSGPSGSGSGPSDSGPMPRGGRDRGAAGDASDRSARRAEAGHSAGDDQGPDGPVPGDPGAPPDDPGPEDPGRRSRTGRTTVPVTTAGTCRPRSAPQAGMPPRRGRPRGRPPPGPCPGPGRRLRARDRTGRGTPGPTRRRPARPRR